MDREPNGLSSEYQANKDHKWAYFEELPLIEEYPAVARSSVDGRGSGACTVVVGFSDELAAEFPITLSLDNIGKDEPCEIAAMIVGLALQTMQQG